MLTTKPKAPRRGKASSGKAPTAEPAVARVFGFEDLGELPVASAVRSDPRRIAFTCFGADSAKKEKLLGSRVVAALRTLKQRAGFARVQLDEALGEDAKVFQNHPFLSGDPVVCCLEGDGALVDALAREMVASQRTMRLVGERPAQPLSSLRVHLVVIDDAAVISEEGPLGVHAAALRESGWRVFVVESPAFDALCSSQA